MNELIQRGLILVVSAPAGTGKTTLVQMLVREFPHVVGSVSYTTRPQRSGEVPGVHYRFVSREEFKQKIEADEFVEYVELYGHYYGTTYHSIVEQQKKGKHVVLVIDTQGALQLKKMFSAIFIFVQPPSLSVLRERLIQRQTENFEVIEQRLAIAQKEMEAVIYYDYCIVNDDLSFAYQALRSILIAEEHRVTYQERYIHGN